MQPYQPPPGFRNPHIQPLYPILFRRMRVFVNTRERIATPDRDFLDLDWAARGINDNLVTVIEHLLRHYPYREIYLSGFSIGDNITLLHLERKGKEINPRIRTAVFFSVPGDLAECSRSLAQPENRIYMCRFLLLLHRKIKDKKGRHPDLFDDREFHWIRDFHAFDNCHTADDPFFTPSCHPLWEAAVNSFYRLKIPPHGGHVGFVACNRSDLYWSEQRGLDFVHCISGAELGSKGEPAERC